MSEEENDFDKFYDQCKDDRKKDVIVKQRKKMPPKTQKQLEQFKNARKIREEKILERKKIKDETNKEKLDI